MASRILGVKAGPVHFGNAVANSFFFLCKKSNRPRSAPTALLLKIFWKFHELVCKFLLSIILRTSSSYNLKP